MDLALNPIEKTYRELISSGKEVIKLFSGNPNEEGILFPSQILEKSYTRYFQNQTYQPHSKGLLKAREAIAGYYASQHLNLNPEHILLTSGTSESFFYLFSLLTQPGDNVLMPHPAYPLFDYIAHLTHTELRHYSLLEDKNWSVDLEDLQNKTDARTKAIILVSPNNPTGAVVSAEQIQKIVEWANSKNIVLVCDEVFSEFYFGSGTFPRPAQVSSPELCFTLNGISKMFALPALKLSWIVITGEDSRVREAVDHLETTADTFLSCHIPIQETLPALFHEGKNFFHSYQKEVQMRRDLALNFLRQIPEIDFVEPQGSFYLMARVKKEMNLSEEEFVIELMKQQGVFVHPGYFYDYENGIHFVISFLTEPERMRRGLEELQAFMTKK